MAGPLTGLTVVDFTHVLAGPACSFSFAQLGADTIKVESVRRGDAMRHRGGTDADRAARGMSTAYLTQGGGKRAIAIDLETPEGAEVFTRLLRKADVLVENHRPSAMKRLGFDESRTAKINPRLIHCAITGYGRGGDREDSPAYDVNIQAVSGLMSLTGTDETGPLRTGAPILDYSVALAAGFAVCAALFRRAETGRGGFVDVSMLDTALTLMSSTIVDLLLTGTEPKPRGNAANSRSPGAGSFRCKEGLLSLGVNEEAQFGRLAIALGRADWATDPRFQNRSARKAHETALEDELNAVLSKRTALEWEAIMLAHDVPAAAVRTVPETLAMTHVLQRSSVSHTGDQTGPFVRVPFRLGETHGIDTAPPRHGADTREILRELSYTDEEVSGLSDASIVV